MNIINEEPTNTWLSVGEVTPHIGTVVAVIVLNRGTWKYYYDYALLVKHTRVSELEGDTILTKTVLSWVSCTTDEGVDVHFWMNIPSSPVEMG